MRQLSNNPTPEQVHGFRTNARRIEALLAAVFDEPRKNERKLLKQLDRGRRRAGRVRDIDVQLENLQQLNLGREEQCRLKVLQRLRSRRKKATKKLVESLDERTRQRLQKRLRRTTDKISKLRSGKSPNRGDSATTNASAFLSKRLQKLQTRLPLSEETVHEYRLRCKRLRYTLELSKDPHAAELIEQLKQVQDAIGKWHDSVVLLESAQSVIDHAGNCPLLSALRNLSKAQLWRALQVTRTTMSSLAGSPPRKPVQSRAAASFTSAASA
ncbi:MAG: CHAD domain-containing protein [Acidobacteriales bacterium]|nr:CHAD domain-containing protein [Terriglobales bacterium]